MPLYGYSLYLEAATVSPEPVQLVRLGPGESTTLTHTVTLFGTERPRRAAHYRHGFFDR